uniref:Leucine-rich repeat-containing N-terminal plant-type domain-containing protein n=1 Tax=Nelumbo nucifera TaxID=4432 RepID=A0A822YBG3_NELNU|nr:TPA_asm: hypothetical protein HUJ06_031388 [Nelumbo nucifera]
MDTHTLRLVLLFVFLVSSSLPSPTLSASSVRCNPSGKRVLLKIKKSLNNPQSLTSWNPNTNCCDWLGVSCDLQTNRVITLSFNGISIPGQIPAAIGDLPYLDTLDFVNVADLTGPIPYSITKLQNLKMLRTLLTNISGPIPEFLHQLKNLWFLDLSYSNFSGPIPASLANLPKLELLKLGGNKLTGNIPDSLWASQNRFLVLDLSQNQLSGDASALFKTNGTLSCLDLSWNEFDFDLSRVKLPESLQYMDLSHNRIRGSIPKEITGLNLYWLNVSYNRLCGEIPFGGKVQEFAHNFTGSIPYSITKLQNLEILRISDTSLSGPIPEFLSQLKCLWSLYLTYNQLSGPIPASLASLNKLQILMLYSNKLTGTIPDSFGSFKDGEYGGFTLDLSHNQLSGGIPTSINKIKVLDLSHNQIHGNIPKQLINKLDLESMDLSYNQLCGKILFGGNVQKMGAKSFAHNRCLCGHHSRTSANKPVCMQ